ncbi:hypothetical protein PAESOLCIP111_05919 [Paenibacillus solanacearum]|uniref:Uncharacterized protein n=1 Tax=Paenibacillus solanacearum TaxID=2048548 RepID=A0A916K6Z0_9BACL|nr:hypothetical protein [Paenibacillus solanacearum]CAG7649670.1 hypothetical protein PAESOLCIP111_05919 [Paenibacillus solanacearum]
MDKPTQQKLMDFLKANFDTDGNLRFLAVSAMKLVAADQLTTLFKVRIAITFQAGDSVIPFFDGTDMYVGISPSSIKFAREHEWADGPPIMEGSPNELALP